MGAICGVVGVDGRPWTPDDLQEVLRALAPLGGDGGGSWSGTAGRCGVALGASLRHATPEDAVDRQPAVSTDGLLVLVGDLRIDNRPDLAASLRVPDVETTPDSAFVLAAYERWGEDMLDRIVGEFALGLVDQRRGGVLLARDHTGARPMLIHERRDVVAFASTALALSRLEGVDRSLDVDHAAEILALAYGSERTFLRGVQWLPPGTALWVDGGGGRPRRWWDPDVHDVVDYGSPETYAVELRDAFDAAVRAHLRTRGLVGVALSGGLDSTSAAATAARLLAPEQLRTYTSVPPAGWRGGERPGWDTDETTMVQALADRYPNIVPFFLRTEVGTSFFEAHERLWELGAGPTMNPCNMLWVRAIRVRAADDGVTTLLTGALGNLFFSADGPQWLAALLRAGRIPTVVREARAWKTSSRSGWYDVLSRELALHILPPRAVRLARRLTGRPTPRSAWIQSTALRPEVAAELDVTTMLSQTDDARDPRSALLDVVFQGGGQADVMAALAAATGVEDRDPTADRRVIEVAMRQPEWVRRRDGMSRTVVRRAMSDRLPPPILDRTRRGEQLPEWLDLMTAGRAELNSELHELEQHDPSRSLIDVERLRQLMNHWPQRERRAEYEITTQYRYALLRALLVSRYMRWFERRGTVTPERSAPRAKKREPKLPPSRT